MLAAKEPLRQRKKARTARTIEEVATQLFDEQGFERTTLEQIAEAADIHKQTVLRYFKSKEEIAFAHRNRLFARFVESLANREGTVLECWRKYIEDASQSAMKNGLLRRWVKFLETDDRLFAYQLHLNQKYTDALADALSEEAGVDPRTDVFARSLAAMLTAANYDVARMAIRSGPDKLIGKYCLEVIDLAESLRRDAIAPKPGGDAAKAPQRSRGGSARSPAGTQRRTPS